MYTFIIKYFIIIVISKSRQKESHFFVISNAMSFVLMKFGNKGYKNEITTNIMGRCNFYVQDCSREIGHYMLFLSELFWIV